MNQVNRASTTEALEDRPREETPGTVNDEVLASSLDIRKRETLGQCIGAHTAHLVRIALEVVSGDMESVRGKRREKVQVL